MRKNWIVLLAVVVPFVALTQGCFIGWSDDPSGTSITIDTRPVDQGHIDRNTVGSLYLSWSLEDNANFFENETIVIRIQGRDRSNADIQVRMNVFATAYEQGIHNLPAGGYDVTLTFNDSDGFEVDRETRTLYVSNGRETSSTFVFEEL